MKSYEHLLLENSQLRGQLNKLWKENQELSQQVAYVIPKASSVENPAWEVPLIVGYPSLLASEASEEATPNGSKNNYRLYFQRELCAEGVFWQLRSLSTTPEKLDRK